MKYFEKFGKLFTNKALYGLIFAFVFLPLALFVVPTMSATTSAETAAAEDSDPIANIVSNREVDIEQEDNTSVNQPVAAVNNTATPADIATNSTTTARSGNYLYIAGKVSSAVVGVGLDASGAIDVPGSAVGMFDMGGATFLDGHSTGVFRGLSRVGVGDIVEFTLNSVTSRYQVVNVATYFYTDGVNYDGSFMNDSLFSGGADGLNMMTCAGSPIGNTYTHRLVVFSVRI